MTEVVIRPTMKFIKTGYIAVLIVVGVASYFAFISPQVLPVWVPAVAALLWLWPIERHMRRQVSKLAIAGDKLRWESGFLSKTTRTISLAKVQDVSVHQTLGQRMTGTGDLSIETAGEASRLTVRSIDRPQSVADEIHTASEAAARQLQQPGGRQAQGGQAQKA
jgi:uncharacterized membrane protein YdbT with pleckstrin-like domain